MGGGYNPQARHFQAAISILDIKEVEKRKKYKKGKYAAAGDSRPDTSVELLIY